MLFYAEKGTESTKEEGDMQQTLRPEINPRMITEHVIYMCWQAEPKPHVLYIKEERVGTDKIKHTVTSIPHIYNLMIFFLQPVVLSYNILSKLQVDDILRNKSLCMCM